MRLLPLRTICSSRTYAFTPEVQLTPTAKNRPPPANSNFYITLLNQCAAEKSITQTRRVQLHMKQTGFPHLSLGNKLISAYLSSGSVDDARNVFDDMPQPHVVSWSSMISSYIRQERPQEAVALYKRMMIENLVPDEFTFSSIFRAFSDLRLFNGGRAAHGQSVVFGLQAGNVYVSSSLVDFYAQFGRLGEARIVYDSVKAKDVVLSTALIVGHTKNGEDRQAILVFGEMLNSYIQANDFTFASVLIACGNLKDLTSGRLIHGAILKSGFGSWIAPQTSLLSMYSKCGLIEDSLKVFNGILNPNNVAWTAIIGCLLHSHREEEALSMFRSMILNSVAPPNAFTLSTTLSVCSSLALFEQGMLIHAYALKSGLAENRFVISALVDTYGKCGHVGMARMVFDSLYAPDLVSLNSLINGYGQSGNGEEAVRLFDMTKRLGIEPNDVTYVNVLSACSNSGMLEEGRRVFSLMFTDHSPGPSNDHYACMVGLLGRSGRLEEAEELLSKVQKPDKVLWRTLLGACKIHGKLEMAKWAARKVLELDPGDEGTYILLSNIYASLGKWKEVINIKCLVREMGFKKDPAVSWIYVNKKIHTFMAGDQSHPDGELIYKELEELIEKTKGLGYVPDTSFVLQQMEEFEMERSLFYHSEKLAVAFGVLSSRGKTCNTITIFKNLRVCGDCHNWIKLVSKVIGKEIIARDAKRFHNCRDGLCSCGDYW
ncbi:pentatricopeptide repeat-containing protein At5g65570 [Dendrobium catenatum]|uniref:Pentatricopeptide repeat-containing protein n=1 Tax=Dendrobium catenatum TaxID=906689 RepID=A0A2I0X1N9_9ASPA|nr:pentatricopeptide repeat-containing protein At5g65570 [Dendrobium catenatum]PKU81838.1 Pentatricopeptide repeat-containing protein [Dendrobium catenatum]